MKPQRIVLALFSLLVAVPAAAQTQATNTNTVASTLRVDVSVVKAVRLTLSTGTQCAVTAGAVPPDYTMSFGTVDALGISAVTCGGKFAPTTPGTSGALYYSDYKLKPLFTSQSTANNTISAYVSADFAATAAGLLTIVQGTATAPSGADAMTAMSTASGTPTTIATNTVNGTEITRHIGVKVAPINGAGVLTGADSATITYTIVVG